MKYPICIALVILVLSTSPNRAQRHKSNTRRAAGMVPFPRIGRANFGRADGSVGLVNYPRVGRSGSLAFEPSGVRDYEAQSRIRSDRDFDVDSLDDFDYNRYYSKSWEVSGARFEEPKIGMELGSLQNAAIKKDRHPRHCNQHADGPWALLFASRDTSNTNQQPIHNFLPRVEREVEAATSSDVI